MQRGLEIDIQEGLNILENLASKNNYNAQIDLVNFYTNGIYIEKDLNKAEYWAKISECNKKGINIKECETDKEIKQ